MPQPENESRELSKLAQRFRPAPRHEGPLAQVLDVLEPLSLADARQVLRLAGLTIDERVRRAMLRDLPEVSLDVLQD